MLWSPSAVQHVSLWFRSRSSGRLRPLQQCLLKKSPNHSLPLGNKSCGFHLLVVHKVLMCSTASSTHWWFDKSLFSVQRLRVSVALSRLIKGDKWRLIGHFSSFVLVFFLCPFVAHLVRFSQLLSTPSWNESEPWSFIDLSFYWGLFFQNKSD